MSEDEIVHIIKHLQSFQEQNCNKLTGAEKLTLEDVERVLARARARAK